MWLDSRGIKRARNGSSGNSRIPSLWKVLEPTAVMQGQGFTQSFSDRQEMTGLISFAHIMSSFECQLINPLENRSGPVAV